MRVLSPLYHDRNGLLAVLEVSHDVPVVVEVRDQAAPDLQDNVTGGDPCVLRGTAVLDIDDVDVVINAVSITES